MASQMASSLLGPMKGPSLNHGGHVLDRAVPGQNEKSYQNNRASRAKYMRRAVPAVPCQRCHASRAVPSLKLTKSVAVCSLLCCAC